MKGGQSTVDDRLLRFTKLTRELGPSAERLSPFYKTLKRHRGPSGSRSEPLRFASARQENCLPHLCCTTEFDPELDLFVPDGRRGQIADLPHAVNLVCHNCHSIGDIQHYQIWLRPPSTATN